MGSRRAGSPAEQHRRALHAGRNPTRESLLRAATHLNHQVPFMVKGVRIQTTPRDYFPISQVRFLRYQRGYWRQFGRLVSAAD